MELQFDLGTTSQLQRNLMRLPDAVGEKVMEQALKMAVRPMGRRMQQEAPRGKGNQRVSLKKRSNDYRRGGATRQDIRIKAVRDRMGEAKVIVGVSKAPGKVGWRTHFITQGVAGFRRITPNDFVRRAFNQTVGEAQKTYGVAIEKVVLRAMKRLGIT